MTQASGRNRRGIGGRRVSPWILTDALVWAIMLIAGLWMRYDFSLAALNQSIGSAGFAWVLLALVITSSSVGWLLGIYRGRYLPGSIQEVSVLTFTLVVSALIVFVLRVAVIPNVDIPRSIPLITGAFTVLAALVLRSTVRRRELFGAGRTENSEPALIFGAGDGGLQLVRQLRRSSVSQFNPVGILDDDPLKRNMLIDGVRVLGSREDIENVALKTGASCLLIAVPSLESEQLLEVRNRAESAGLHVLVLPPLDSLMRSRVAVNELREINVNDLLGRKPARLNLTQIADHLRGKRILVTGAGGSIGSELCRQLTRFRPSELIMLDRDESGLHAVQLSIHDQAMLDGDDTVLASIRDRQALMDVFAERKPQIVFHAAALKHMPLLEQFPLEALKTNVIGTLNVLEASAASGVETFVNISTDKAANPCSALGVSKRIAERLTSAKAKSGTTTKYVSVRFGNVLGSRGSVLTVFEKQIESGGPLTVTDPEVNRFFMTIPEACQLVLQAAAVGKSGMTLVLDMGTPVKIADVARTLIEQSGKPIEIVYTGLRENEKLAEELFDDSESPESNVDHPALSNVYVEPLDVDFEALRSIDTHAAASNWMSFNAYQTEATK
ncbi:putative nucleoside-diphosphate sugar epimerase [Dietzia cinnamea P4]|nr:putative nucleoside-diphosphate sugar epimerase [Dietzia cinnamea P4]